jgi:hypothetical protein
MFRAAIISAIGISLFVSLPLFGAEIRFKKMKLPPNVNVQVEGSTARVSGAQLGIETVWNCLCAKGEGTCTVRHDPGMLACEKGPTDNCKADCFLSVDLGGLFAPEN